MGQTWAVAAASYASGNCMCPWLMVVAWTNWLRHRCLSGCSPTVLLVLIVAKVSACIIGPYNRAGLTTVV